ncbi:MAG: hypothetical protein Q4G42_01610 [Neisseria sp.]|nr:hypothetical protein [Neisseria sp.]
MRIVSWNCHGALRKKFPELLALAADVYIVQECENPAETRHEAYQYWAQNALWIGRNKHKGLGVFANTRRLVALDWDSTGLEYFIPFTVGGQLTLVAVWACRGDGGSSRYIAQVWAYLQKNQAKTLMAQPLLIGDFNSNAIWDFKRKHNHSAVVKELAEMGLASIYHTQHQEKHGEEKQPTFFLYRKLERPYHIDYAFIPKALQGSIKISIGRAEDWLMLSDHMPMIIDI